MQQIELLKSLLQKALKKRKKTIQVLKEVIDKRPDFWLRILRDLHIIFSLKNIFENPISYPPTTIVPW